MEGPKKTIKKRTLLIATMAVMVVVLPYCNVFHKKNKAEKYDIPATYPTELVPQLKDEIDKGEELFKTYCASCHGIFGEGKQGVMNFTDTQLHKYTARFVMGDPENHAAAFKMNPEQLNQIVVFLTYRRVKNKHTDSLDRR